VPLSEAEARSRLQNCKANSFAALRNDKLKETAIARQTQILRLTIPASNLAGDPGSLRMTSGWTEATAKANTKAEADPYGMTSKRGGGCGTERGSGQ